MRESVSAPELQCLGREALRSDIDRASVPAAICGGFAGVREGLYVFVFFNGMDQDVRDYPKNASRQKIVVHRRGMSIKPGTFAEGFITRVRDYDQHLHRAPTGGGEPEWALAESFREGFLLDLTSTARSIGVSAGVFEAYWIEAVNAYLKAASLLADPPIVQLERSEWRHLKLEGWTTEIRDEFYDYMKGVTQRVLAMAGVAALPALPHGRATRPSRPR